jgi:hypothetical protein
MRQRRVSLDVLDFSLLIIDQYPNNNLFAVFNYCMGTSKMAINNVSRYKLSTLVASDIKFYGDIRVC